MQRIPLYEKVGYSLGDASANLVFQMMMIYQLKFYTDVFGLEGSIAGTVLLVARIVDAFVDPCVGILSDKTQTRWGKFRPWVVWTALPFMVFYVLAFHNPGIADKGLVALYATLSYVLLMSLYSANNTPYSSLGGVMTDDIHERTSITSIRFVAATVAQFVVQGMTLPLVHKFGEGAGRSLAQGWTLTISLFALVGFVFLVVAGLAAHERITPPREQPVPVRASLGALLRSSSWRPMFLLTLFVFTTLAMWGSSMCYYFQYVVDPAALSRFLATLGLAHADGTPLNALMTALDSFGLVMHTDAAGHADASQAYAIGLSLFNMIGAVVQLVGVMLLSERLAARFGKRATFIVCLALTALLTGLFYLPSPTSVGAIFLLGILKSLAYAPTVPLLWAMIADVADHIELTTHRRTTGICFSGIVFALKAGLGVGGAIAGLLLTAFGYVATQAPTAHALTGIRLASSLLPALTFALGVACLIAYPITKKYNQQMQETLKARRK